MDTLFRLVSLQSSSSSDHHHHHHHHHNHHHPQSSSFTSNSHSSLSSKPPSHHYYNLDPDQECCNTPHPSSLFMDEDFSSSSSSKHLLPSSSSTPPPPPPPIPPPPPSHLLFDPSSDFSSLHLDPTSTPRWSTDLLLDCARSISSRDTTRLQQHMWMLNELSSPYGDVEQKLSSYFLQALFSRLTSSGPRTLRTLCSASDKTSSFDSTRRTLLRFQELSPWSTFGHVAANGAILESFLDSQRLHILDLSSTFCTQWPTLLEALATRSADDAPHLSITTVAPSASQRVMREVGARMEKFARLMGVPFRFNAVHHSGDLSTLDFSSLGVDSGDTLAINCVNSLHGVSPAGHRRELFVSMLRGLNPRIVTVVEEEAELDVDDDDEGFLRGFREALRFFGAYFDSLEESFPRASNERLALERAAGRAVVDLVACPAVESSERRETAAGWSRKLHAAGFTPVNFSDDVADDVRALLRRYKEGWSLRSSEEVSGAGAGLFLGWKEQPMVWASAWKLS
ncbi:protein SHORT-ROOT 1 [Dioscorea cayenensis subsp. rotundata]|uniref:Protein SHORT-ROOT 1 n=1 Tax=Dioscorea cayennensis subsp. rotundata TaxID=55577 RepID=A0AB40AS15_DIOCR|nr:protein SHORT-ROOT 1 [Dioscorea cayenensis subsp. rotundata]